MRTSFLYSKRFWSVTIIALLCSVGFFAWELNLISIFNLSSPARPTPTTSEIVLAFCIAIIFSINIGLFLQKKKDGSCPIGGKTVTGIAGLIGGIALLCPACALGSLSFIGITGLLILISPYALLFQVIALVLLIAVLLTLLLPKR